MDPTLQPVAPAPESPQGAPGIPTEAPGELSQEQMKANLQELMAKIDAKYQDFNTQKFSSDNKLKEQRSAALRQVFDLLQSAGVDPSNPEEVRGFLDDLKGQNPELSQQIEKVLQELLGEEPAPEAEPEVAPLENMNIQQNEESPETL